MTKARPAVACLAMALGLGLLGCTSTDEARQEGPSSLVGDGERSAGAASASGADGAAASTAADSGSDALRPSQPFDALPNDQVSVVNDAAINEVNACLRDAGFPHVIEPVDLADPSFEAPGFRADDFGPATEEQAARMGMLDRGDLPYTQKPAVWSNDPAYDAALESCRGDVASRYPGAFELGTTYNDLLNEVDAAMFNHLDADQRFMEALESQLECVAEGGFPRVDAATLIEADDLRVAFGVEGGQVRTIGEEDAPPAEGVQTVVLQPAEQTFEPTAEEVELARTWVSCRDTTTFDEQVYGVYRDAQLAALEPYEVTVAEMSQRADALLQEMLDDGLVQ